QPACHMPRRKENLAPAASPSKRRACGSGGRPSRRCLRRLVGACWEMSPGAVPFLILRPKPGGDDVSAVQCTRRLDLSPGRERDDLEAGHEAPASSNSAHQTVAVTNTG